MLSYRHAYHAGNNADVLKHLVIERILSYLTQKPKPCFYLDTHAGAGRYALDTAIANKTAEYLQGIHKILPVQDAPEVMENYLALVRLCMKNYGEHSYPGSPWVAGHCLRPIDRLALCELHPQDAPLLAQCFERDKRVKVYPEDGFTKSIALMPPAYKRGLVVIDPSYEIKSDYTRVVEHVKKLHQRFATGVFAVWFPVVDAAKNAMLEARFKQSGIKNVQLFELQTTSSGNPGMFASGMIVVNAPWTLNQDMAKALPWLVAHLGQDEAAKYRIETLCPE